MKGRVIISAVWAPGWGSLPSFSIKNSLKEPALASECWRVRIFHKGAFHLLCRKYRLEAHHTRLWKSCPRFSNSRWNSIRKVPLRHEETFLACKVWWQCAGCCSVCAAFRKIIWKQEWPHNSSWRSKPKCRWEVHFATSSSSTFS